MQRLTKRNIKVINHDTGQQIDFPTFGKEAGEDAYNQVSNQLTSLQSQLESSIASMSEVIAQNDHEMVLGNADITNVIIAGHRIIFNQNGTVTWKAIE